MSFSKQSVDLFHELKCHIVFIEDQRIHVLDNYGYFPLFEEYLELLPVVFLLLEVFSVVERMHLNVLRKVAREYLSHKEAIVERPVYCLQFEYEGERKR